MPSPLANSWFQQIFYQETPDALWRLGEPVSGGYAQAVVDDAALGYWRLGDSEGYAQAVLSDGAVGYWRLNSNATDSASTPHNGTVTGGVTFGQTGPLADGSTAALFDGSTGYVETADNAAWHFGTGTMSVECWFKTSDGTNYEQLIDTKTAGTNTAGFNVQVNNGVPGKVDFRIANGSAQISCVTPQTFTDGSWHHLVGTLTRGTPNQLAVYIDGVLKATQNTPADGWNITPTLPLDFGRYNGLASGTLGDGHLAGSLKDIALYNYALSARQIANHYALRTSTVATVAPATFVDASGNNHPATIVKSVQFGQAGALADGNTAAEFERAGGGFAKVATYNPFNLATSITIEGWVNHLGVAWTSGGLHEMVESWASAGHYISVESGFLLGSLFFTTAAQKLVNGPAMATSGWHHVVLTWSSGDFARLYLDGTQVGISATAITDTLISAPGVQIGSFDPNGDPTALFNGALDEIAAYPYALTATQIARHYALRTSTLATLALTRTAADATLNALTGTVHGPILFGQVGYPSDGDAGATFADAGGQGYIDVGNVAALAYTGPFSVMAAINTPAAATSRKIVTKAFSATSAGWILTLDTTGKVRFVGTSSVPAAVFDLTSAARVDDATWHLVIGTYDPVHGSATLYVDGTAVATTTPSGALAANAAHVFLGTYDNGAGAPAGTYWAGLLDEVALYPYALRQSQVTAIVAARTKPTNDKALMQARAGILRSGASRSNFYTPRNIVLLNGVEITRNIWKNTLETTEILSEQPNAAKLRVYTPGAASTLVPQCGQTLICADGATNNRYFGGTIVKVTRAAVPDPDDRGVQVHLFDLDVTDWTWLLGRRVVTTFIPLGTPANVALVNVITAFTSGFTTRHVKSAPTLPGDLNLIGIPVPAALTEIGNAVGWTWRVDVDQDIHFFADSETTQRPKDLVPGVYNYNNLNFTIDLTQIRTRIYVQGAGAKTTAPVAPGTTSIPVDDTSWFVSTGGTLISNYGEILHYTGRSTASGPGTLTGVPASGVGAIHADLKQGDDVRLWMQVDDTAAQAAVALLEGGDGIHEFYITSNSSASGTEWNVAQCLAAAQVELDAYKDVVISGTLWSLDKAMAAGKRLNIQLPGRSISATVAIQQVRRTLMTLNRWQFDVTFATTFQNIVMVLKRLALTR
jgi:concanavalin A-like lectin/glucanase superfamily protein